MDTSKLHKRLKGGHSKITMLGQHACSPNRNSRPGPAPCLGQIPTGFEHGLENSGLQVSLSSFPRCTVGSPSPCSGLRLPCLWGWGLYGNEGRDPRSLSHLSLTTSHMETAKRWGSPVPPMHIRWSPLLTHLHSTMHIEYKKTHIIIFSYK